MSIGEMAETGVTSVTNQKYDAAAFARALGLDPMQITDDGIDVTFSSGMCLLRWQSIKVLTPQKVQAALDAALRREEQS